MQTLTLDELILIRDALNKQIHALVVAGVNEGGNPEKINEATRTAEARDKVQAEIDQRSATPHA